MDDTFTSTFFSGFVGVSVPSVIGVEVAITVGEGEAGAGDSCLSTAVVFFCFSLILWISLKYAQSVEGLWAAVGVPGARSGLIPADRLG